MAYFYQGYQNMTSDRPALTYELDERYFLTDPDTFIYDHRPMLDEWQLLARTVSMSEFKVKHQFLPHWLEFKSPPKIMLLHLTDR